MSNDIGCLPTALTFNSLLPSLSELQRNPYVKTFSFFLNHKEQRDENEHINLSLD